MVLQPTASGAIGRCPFHDDLRPSLGVNDEGEYWHCLAACGGGSLIDFRMKWRESYFASAIRELAEIPMCREAMSHRLTISLPAAMERSGIAVRWSALLSCSHSHSLEKTRSSQGPSLLSYVVSHHLFLITRDSDLSVCVELHTQLLKFWPNGICHCLSTPQIYLRKVLLNLKRLAYSQTEWV